MKRFLIITAVAIPFLCAIALAIRCEAQANKAQGPVEWKQIDKNLDDSLDSTIRGLENLPKFGE